MKGSSSILKILMPGIVILSMIASGCTPATATPAPVVTPVPPTVTPEPVASPTPTEIPTADELIIAIPEDISNYEPFKGQGDMHTPVIFKMLYDNLIQLDTHGKLVPGLATSWSWVDDRTLELDLRSGVTFHNGQEFTAADVLYSMDLLRSIPQGAAFASIESVEVVDPLTVKVHTNKVDSQLVYNMTQFLSILPAETINSIGVEAYALHPIGTGPYMFVEHERDQFIKLTANPNYFDGSFKGLPIVKDLTIRFIPELATRLAELQAGTVDIAVGVTNDKVDQINSTEGLHVETGQGTAYYMLPFAFKTDVDAPYNDIHVREALAYATDVQSIMDALAGGYGTLIAGPFTSITTGYDPSFTPWPYDKAKAIELLAAAGYADGFSLTIDVASSVPTDIVMAIAGQWAEVGVTLNVVPMEVGHFNELWMGHANDDMIAVGINAETEPGSFVYIWTCGGVISYYCNTAFETPYNQGIALLDDTLRAAAFKQAFQVLRDDVPAIYLWASDVHWGVSNKVTTFAFTPDGSLIPSLIDKVK
jgi:peptide/nickel transport system substrate-binding protein